MEERGEKWAYVGMWEKCRVMGRNGEERDMSGVDKVLGFLFKQKTAYEI